MNKKASEKLLTIWWFFVLIVIGVGVVSATWLFYNSGVNVKSIESEVLLDRINSCLNDINRLNDNFLKSDFNLEEECKLNKKVLENGKFLSQIYIYNVGNKIVSIELGNPSLKKDCEVKKVISTKHYPECSMKNISYYSKSLSDYVNVVIFTSSNNDGGSIK
jgi:hypothetical protein